MNTKNIWLFAGVLVAVVVAGVFLVRKPKTTATTSGMPVPGATGVEEKKVVEEEEVREIEVSGKEYSFSPSSVSVKKGEKIKITFTNNGNLPHNLVIDELGVSTKTIAPGKSDTVEFTAEGDVNLTFYCNIGNHRAQGMEGTIKIEELR